MSQEVIMPNNWRLSDQGLLWKAVVKSASDRESFLKCAEELVEQLQKAVKPRDALEGLVLDRIAAGYLRKLLLIESEAKYKDYRRQVVHTVRNPPSEETAVFALATTTLAPNDCIFEGMMKYESALDRGFHRDGLLLLQLQKITEESASLSPRKQSQSVSKTYEGEPEKDAIG